MLKSHKAIQSTRLRCYKCQLDEQWFDLTKDTLRDALQITPVNNTKAFSSPQSSDALINSFNELGYPKLVRNLSNVRKHKFHPRPDSPLHLSNEEPVLGYLKFSAIFLVTFSQLTFKRALEESLKSIYDAPRGPLPPVVIREPEFGKYQPLPEVQGKGKEKVTDEQVARDLLTLQTPKKKSTADQYIFQRRTSTPTRSSGHDESSSLYAELRLTDSEVESDEDVLGINAGVQSEGQAGPNPGDDAVS
nr:hypothetical protein [Tanacetum cinerariifolium]